jgi:hypothetical protein
MKVMKKIFSIMISVSLFSLYANSVEDSAIVFSTVGPDKYSDGSTVLDGELYALVWTNDGVFEGFSADGKALDEKDKILIVAPLAKDGRCPKVMFQISRAAAVNYGKFEVFVMDTRVVAATGVVTPRGAENGEVKLVNGYGRVPAKISLSNLSSKAEGAAVANLNSAAPKDARQPRVKAMRIEGDEVVLTVENLPGYMRVQSGRDASTSDSTGAALEAPASGDTVTIKAPKVGDSGFYRVIRTDK